MIKINWKNAFIVLCLVIWFAVGSGLVINKKLNSQGFGYVPKASCNKW